MSSAYHDRHMGSAAALVSGAYTYSNGQLLLEEVLTPGFFPERAGLLLGDLLIVTAGDGWTMARVSGFDAIKRPILDPMTFGAAAAPAVSKTRKAA